MQTKHNATVRSSNQANTHLCSSEAYTVKPVKKQSAAVPSPLSLIHEIKQNMSKKNEEFKPMQCFAAQPSKCRKSSVDSSDENLPGTPLQEQGCQLKQNQLALESRSHENMNPVDASEQDKSSVPFPPSLDNDEIIQSDSHPVALSFHVASSETDSANAQSSTNQAPEVIHQIPVLITQKNDPVVPFEEECFSDPSAFDETVDTTTCIMQATEKEGSVKTALNDHHNEVETLNSKGHEISNDIIKCNVEEQDVVRVK